MNGSVCVPEIELKASYMSGKCLTKQNNLFIKRLLWGRSDDTVGSSPVFHDRDSNVITSPTYGPQSSNRNDS